MKILRSIVALYLLCCISAPLSVFGSGSTLKTETETQETFEIDGTTYVIPPRWEGKRIAAPSPAAIAFSQIPQTNTHNGTKLYISREANEALKKLMDEAQKDGIDLVVESGFRSYNYQMRIFTKLLNTGRKYEDIIRYVAPPGYSQHALGTAVDFYPSNWEFAGLPAYTWLQENANRFGFSETYPRISTDGSPWEAWHWNYQPEHRSVKTDTEVMDGTFQNSTPF